MALQLPGQLPEPEQTFSAKRRRVGLACNICRTRKTRYVRSTSAWRLLTCPHSRCNGERPSCSTCLALNFDCRYEPSDASTNVIVRKEYMSDLDQRVIVLENTVKILSQKLDGHLDDRAHHPSLSSAATVPADVENSRATDLEEPQDENAPTDGMAMIFVEEKTSSYFGESSNIDFTRLLLRAIAAVRQSGAGVQATPSNEYTVVENNMMSVSQTWSSPAVSSTEIPSLSLMALPPREETNAMLETYFNTTGLLFPFIHESTLRSTYADFQRNGFSRVRRTWLGLLNMIFALASTARCGRDASTSAEESIQRSNLFFQRATSLCGEVSKRVLNLEIVQYQLLAVLYCQGSRRSVRAWNDHGSLVRSALALGLHVKRNDQAFDSHHEESRCRTWLTIYCLDKVLSMTFGRPAAIPDEQMVSLQPAPWQPLSGSHVQADDISGAFLGVSFRLYQLMGRSLIRQYGANMGRDDLRLDEAASLQACGEFRTALRTWASNLPTELRLCEAESRMLKENSQINRLRVILTLRYHNVNILVHRPLLSATIRDLFLRKTGMNESPQYLAKLAMAEAHECIRSAESTIDIVHTVLSVDRTGKNNLGVWFFTLYYG